MSLNALKSVAAYAAACIAHAGLASVAVAPTRRKPEERAAFDPAVFQKLTDHVAELALIVKTLAERAKHEDEAQLREEELIVEAWKVQDVPSYWNGDTFADAPMPADPVAAAREAFLATIPMRKLLPIPTGDSVTFADGRFVTAAQDQAVRRLIAAAVSLIEKSRAAPGGQTGMMVGDGEWAELFAAVAPFDTGNVA